MILRPDGGLFEKIDFEIEAFALKKQWWNPAELRAVINRPKFPQISAKMAGFRSENKKTLFFKA